MCEQTLLLLIIIDTFTTSIIHCILTTIVLKFRCRWLIYDLCPRFIDTQGLPTDQTETMYTPLLHMVSYHTYVKDSQLCYDQNRDGSKVLVSIIKQGDRYKIRTPTNNREKTPSGNRSRL